MKNFDPWNEKKKSIDSLEREFAFFEGEIWWTRLGVNIGIEQNGKSEKFTRPILILKKYNRCHLLALPLTTQSVSEKFGCKIDPNPVFLKEPSWIVFSQIKAIDKKRLHMKIGRLSDSNFGKIKKKFFEHVCLF